MGELLNLSIRSVPDANARRKIFTLNPQRPHGFNPG